MLHWLDRTLPTPEENLALDEALLLEAESGRGGDVLRLWELPEHAVVLGSAGVVRDDVRVAECEADGVPILRRVSGGGTVLLGPGCLVFSLVLSVNGQPALQDVTHSYVYILDRMARALGTQQPVARAGCSDLAIGDLKVSGNSQRRLRRCILHHGTLLYDYDAAPVAKYLLEPKRQPDYRRRREHCTFLTNLRQSRSEIVSAMRTKWNAGSELRGIPVERVAQLVREKYAAEAWTWRR